MSSFDPQTGCDAAVASRGAMASGCTSGLRTVSGRGPEPATPPLVAEVAELAEFLAAFGRVLDARGAAERVRLAVAARDWRAPAVLGVLQAVYGDEGAGRLGTHEPNEARQVLAASALELRRLGRVLLDAAVLVAAEAHRASRRGSTTQAEAESRVDGPTGRPRRRQEVWRRE